MPVRVAPLSALALLVLAAGAAVAQPMTHASMPGMTHADTGPSSQAFKAANDKMMKDMDVPMTGDTDRDFVASMIPHHAGAIDMARIQLQYGHDPKLRALAQDIVAAQEKEIAEMQEWQKTHPPMK